MIGRARWWKAVLPGSSGQVTREHMLGQANEFIEPPIRLPNMTYPLTTAIHFRAIHYLRRMEKYPTSATAEPSNSPIQSNTDAARSGIAAVLAHGRSSRLLLAGEPAPAFSLKDSDGNTRSSKRALAGGPLLAVFIRGTWCSCCKAELAAVEAAADDIRKHGASIFGVSSGSREELAEASRELGLSYPLLIDEDGRVGELYGLRWQIPLQLAVQHPALSAELLRDHAVFAIPGRFVIDKSGTVAYADVDPDFTQRLNPKELFPTLGMLRGIFSGRVF